MSKKNDTSTGKLKISQVRGPLAKRICIILTDAVEKALQGFYDEHLKDITTPTGSIRVLPMIRFYNQSDLINFLQPWGDGRKSIGMVYSRTPVENLPYPEVKDFILLFEDTVRIDIEWKSQKCVYKYVNAASEIRVEIKIICLDRQKFLDSLGIEPNIEIPRYVDIMGNEVHEGDVICVSGHDGARLYLDKVKKLSPYAITTDNGKIIKHEGGYESKLVVVSDLPYHP